MKGLLRFQGVLLMRLVGPVYGVALAAACFLVWDGAATTRWTGTLMTVAGGLIVAPLMLAGMARTFQAVDDLRWRSPVSARSAWSAHLAFWTSVMAGGALLVVALRWAAGADGEWLRLLDLVLFGGVVAAAIPTFHAIGRHARTMYVLLLVPLSVVTLYGSLFGVAQAVSGETAIGAAVLSFVFCVWLAAGGVFYLREDRLPVAAVGGRVVFEKTERERNRPRSPASCVLRSAYGSSGLVWIWVMVAAMNALMPVSYAVFMIPVATVSVTGCGLPSWRWLLATPIDRRRAFRLLFVPVLAFMALLMTTRIVLVEAMTERSAFFRDYRDDAASWWLGPNALSLYKVLGPSRNDTSYRRPDVAQIAARVRDHLEDRYGLHVTEERIEAAMRRGWPTDPPTGIMDWEQQPTLDAMERVRVDLADEIAGAARRRDFANAAASVLGFLVLFRLQFLGKRRALVFLGALIGTLVLGSLVPGVRSHDWFHAAFQDAPWPVPALLYLSAAGAGVLLWRGSARAFRRLELTDLAPGKIAWGAKS